MIMPKYLTTEVQLRRFIHYSCQLYISIPWGDILDLSESCPESCAGRIFVHTNIRLNGARIILAFCPADPMLLLKGCTFTFGCVNLA